MSTMESSKDQQELDEPHLAARHNSNKFVFAVDLIDRLLRRVSMALRLIGLPNPTTGGHHGVQLPT
jgi:hypothetical protein